METINQLAPYFLNGQQLGVSLLGTASTFGVIYAAFLLANMAYNIFVKPVASGTATYVSNIVTVVRKARAKGAKAKPKAKSRL